MVKRNCSVFISGQGTNLLNILKHTRDYNFPINIKLIVSNNYKAKGNNISKKYSIPFYFFKKKDLRGTNQLLHILKIKRISLICLAGYMSIIPKYFLRNFRGKIINIHPSLLPKHKGLNTYKKVKLNKDKRMGCTTHYVTEKLDSGKIINQKWFYTEQQFDEDVLKIRTQKIEHNLYFQSLIKIYRN